MKAIRIFVSSPGDVRKERKITEKLIRSIGAEFGIVVNVTYSNLLINSPDIDDKVNVEEGTLVLCPYFWEYQRFQPDRGYQEQIPSTSKFDLGWTSAKLRGRSAAAAHTDRRVVAFDRVLNIQDANVPLPHMQGVADVKELLLPVQSELI